MLQEINFNVDLNMAFKEIKFSKVHGLNISGDIYLIFALR